MTNNQLAKNSVNQLLNSVRLARDNAERADNRVDHSFYYALTIALEKLQERRKTGSEPYGFTDGDRRGMIYKPEYADRLNEPLPVYRHAQPAPVVPDDYQRLRELYHAQEKRLFKIAQRIKGPAFDKYSHSPSQAIDVLEGAIFGEDGACRAAMLAAAPQSPGGDHATVPGKWIPVSERMPEVGVKVLCFPAEDEPIHAVFNGQLWLQDVSWSASYEPIDNVIPITVTHWMPLPAAPQEVNRE